ncbi:MAG: alpha/beta hydrolase [Burkholderiaceae bacterium]|nr:MAG: alpha/beta hydrolase [Burkholderiaceae bacterium]
MTNKVAFDRMEVRGMDVDINLITRGAPSGIPLIFLPGITSYSVSFSSILAMMPDRFYSMSMDIRGRGRSTWPKRGYRLDNYVDDLLNVLNAVVGNPVAPVLVGHSMGARIAAAFASRYSRLISGMVLIDPPVNGPGQRQVYPNSLAMFLNQKAMVEQGRMDVFRGSFPNFSAAQVEERAQEYLNVSTEALIESYESLLREPFHIHIKAAQCPVLLLAAEHGDTIRPEECAVLQLLNGQLEAIRVQGVSHMIYKEAPEETASYIVEFVDRCTSRQDGKTA